MSASAAPLMATFSETVQKLATRVMTTQTENAELKVIPLTGGSQLMVPDQLKMAFGPRAFAGDKAYKPTMVFKLTDDQFTAFQELECKVIALGMTYEPKLFGDNQTEDEVLSKFKSFLSCHEQYGSSLRVKINLTKVRYWNVDKTQREAPDAEYFPWSRHEYKVKLSLQGLWVTADHWGLMMQATDLQIIEKPIECPF